MAELLSAPVAPDMPVTAEENPDRYARAMRLLLLVSCMKSFDVVALMMPSDEENMQMFALVGEMRHMLQYVTRRKNEIEGRPQVASRLPTHPRASHLALCTLQRSRTLPHFSLAYPILYSRRRR